MRRPQEVRFWGGRSAPWFLRTIRIHKTGGGGRMAAPPPFADVTQLGEQGYSRPRFKSGRPRQWYFAPRCGVMYGGERANISLPRRSRALVYDDFLFGCTSRPRSVTGDSRERPALMRRPWLEGITTDEGGSASPGRYRGMCQYSPCRVRSPAHAPMIRGHSGRICATVPREAGWGRKS